MNYIQNQPSQISRPPQVRGLEFDPDRLVNISPKYNTVENRYLRTSASDKKKPTMISDPILDGSFTGSPIIHRPDSDYIPWNDQPRSSMAFSRKPEPQPFVQSIIPEPVNPQKPPSFNNSGVNNSPSQPANFNNSNIKSKYTDLINAMNNPRKFQTGFDSCKKSLVILI